MLHHSHDEPCRNATQQNGENNSRDHNVTSSIQWQGKPIAWRVSWAALCNFASCASPTPNTKNEPTNKQARPTMTRCETDALEVEILCVVMSPSVRPVEQTLLFGRSPDSRLSGSNAFPVSQWHMSKPNHSQLRGQSRFWPRLGNPHRVPYYASGRLAFKAPNIPSWQGPVRFVNQKATR